MRRTSLITAGLLLCATGARAQSPAAIQAYIQQQNRHCSVYAYQENFRGSVPGLAHPVTIATYTLESCGGGNDYTRTVAVFDEINGHIRRFRSPRIEGPEVDAKDGVRVRGDRMIVRSLGYGPNDPRCCPTVRRETAYRLADGLVAEAR